MIPDDRHSSDSPVRGARAAAPLAPVLVAILLMAAQPAIAHLSIIRHGAESRGSIEAGDHSGSALAVGDFNGDGFDDLAVGAPDEDLTGIGADGGAVIVSYGSAFGITHVGAELVMASSIGQTGQAGARFGAALAAADFNRDGYDDLVIGAPNEDIGGVASAGRVYIVRGRSNGFDITSLAIDQTSAGGALETNDLFGSSFAIGNFNGDATGFQDLAIGSPGEDASAGAVFINYFGSPFGLTTGSATFLKQSSLGGTNDAGDRFGHALAAANLLGTSSDDLAIGAPYNGGATFTELGAVWICSGTTSGITSSGALFYDAPAFGTLQSGTHFGYALAAGQFFSGSFASLAIGEPGRTVTALTQAGRVIVARGGSTGLDVVSPRVLVQGAGGGTVENGDRFGSVLCAGDFDDIDGFDDVAVGSPSDGLGATPAAGMVNIFPGAAGGPPGAGWSAYTQNVCGDRNENGDQFGAALAFGRFDASERGAFAVGVPGEAYDDTLGVIDPVVRDDAGLVHVIAPWRQPFGLIAWRSIAYDCEDNLVFSAKPFDRVRIASTTKIMTVLIACEKTQLMTTHPEYENPNQPYTVPAWVADDISGSQVPLVEGEGLTLQDLMYTCLMKSGNDAAHGIADLIGSGSTYEARVIDFVAEMNARAAALGMTRTHFHNPAGLDNNPVGGDLGVHESAPYDMMRLSRFAMRNPLFRQIAGTMNYTWTRTDYPTIYGDVDFAFTIANIFNGVLGNAIQPLNGIKGGCTRRAQDTGCFSARATGAVDFAIGGTFTSPLIQNKCPLGSPQYATDAGNLLKVALNECSPAYFLALGGTMPWKLVLGGATTQDAVTVGAGGEIATSGDVAVDLTRLTGSGATSLNLDVGHVMDLSIDPGRVETVGITPFHSHQGFLIQNEDSVGHVIEVTPSVGGMRTRYTLGPYQKIVIPPYPGTSQLTGYTLSIVNVNTGSGPAAIGVEALYRFPVATSSAPGTTPFFSARLRRPVSGSEHLSVVTTGTDALNRPSDLFVAAHEASVPVGVGDPPAPGTDAPFTVLPAAPNPFSDRTRIEFDLREPGRLGVDFYDLAGRRVRSFPAAALPPGRWGLEWDGRGDDGVPLRSGIYFYRVTREGAPAGRGRVIKTGP